MSAVLSPAERQATIDLLQIVAAQTQRTSRRKLDSYFPDEGPLRRELYQQHLKFFALGVNQRKRLMLAANRVGKTESVGLYELTLHLTGQYPAWWVGRRFTRPITAWAAGDTGKTVRDILQAKLLGPVGSWGTGVLPGDSILRLTRGSGVADSIDGVFVKHVSGGTSTLNLKSYDSRRVSFQGTAIDVILLDEEPPLDIYTECLMRTMTNDGMLMLTFTPLQGLSEVVLVFLPGGKLPEDGMLPEAVVMATWDDVPHLTEAAKADLMRNIPPYQRDARSKGVPQLGAGAIYPVPESDIGVEPFEIPKHWPRVYGFDVGWNRSAAIWIAIDRETGTDYAYSEHYRGQAEPSVVVQGIHARGKWIPGVIDPAARGRGQRDGEQLLNDYLNQGLKVTPAQNAVESGLFTVWERLSTGRLKVFKTLGNWLSEYRIYRRDEKGNVVKGNDHLMDATRYAEVSGRELAITEPFDHDDEPEVYHRGSEGGGWMG